MVKIKKSPGEWAFDILNYAVLGVLALLCVLPFIHMLAVSFSDSAVVTQGKVGLWPVNFALNSYIYTFRKPEFLSAFFVSIRRVLLGVSIDMILLIFAAYPLSKSNRQMPGRTFISWIFVVTMFISGGMIPTYLIVSATHLRNTIWALVLPGAVQAWNITILLNFFRQIPPDLEEASLIDGASQLNILFRVYLPLSLPALATLVLFDSVGHWNDWFAGLIYMNSAKSYPLQTYLRGILIQPNFTLVDITQLQLLSKISNKTYQAAQVIIGTVPILLVYPFLQRYFISGMTLGSLKG